MRRGQEKGPTRGEGPCLALGRTKATRGAAGRGAVPEARAGADVGDGVKERPGGSGTGHLAQSWGCPFPSGEGRTAGGEVPRHLGKAAALCKPSPLLPSPSGLSAEEMAPLPEGRRCQAMGKKGPRRPSQPTKEDVFVGGRCWR